MKKVILSIVTVIALASCSRTNNIDKRDMPTAVAYKFKNEKFDDTLHIINYQDKNEGKQIYMFTQDNHFKGEMDETNDMDTIVLILFIIGLCFGLAIGLSFRN